MLTARSRAAGIGLFCTWYYAGMTVLPGAAGWLQDVVGGAAAVECAAAAVFLTLGAHLAFRTGARRRAPAADRSG